tara:strand:+ start:88 stop:351 length:264 start_codon:yes stop_codon:yes gene_type:complete
VAEGLVWAIATPVMLFLLIVAPIWIIVHYRQRGKEDDGLNTKERVELSELARAANKMAARIETLEAILDAETPDWRDKERQQQSGQV